ncbi:MAG: hypothetical protein ACI9VT_003537 [Psychroserpens sp.]
MGNEVYMDFLTSTVLSGMLYDGFKKGAALTADFLKEKLQGWLYDDVLVEQLAYRLKELELDDLSENAIERKINATPAILYCIKEIKIDQNIDSITQFHSGSGDNVVGNKVTYNK